MSGKKIAALNGEDVGLSRQSGVWHTTVAWQPILDDLGLVDCCGAGG